MDPTPTAPARPAPDAMGDDPIVLMFPGQSSRRVDMLEAPLTGWPTVTLPLVERASERLGRDLRRLYRAGDADPFVTNQNVQVGVFLANHLRLAVLDAEGVRAPLSLGLSLGEYNHLVHIGALGFEDALSLVDARGRHYDAGPAGAMAAVFPLDLGSLTPIVERARRHGVLEVSNFNSPSQHVISGDRAAVDEALTLLEDEECVFGRIIEDRIPMHCSRFAPVADALRPALTAAAWRAPRLPYLPNVVAARVPNPSPARVVELLCEHVHRPVRWRDSIDHLGDAYPQARFVEVGPGAVLHGLFARSWRRNEKHHTDDVAHLTAAIAALRDAGSPRGA